ncbi:MAG: SIR2 family NAD-dependent protein deacylase [Tenacibaculum sp.]
MKRKIVILTGAGMSAESGIKTFRGSSGLWEGHNISEVASPEGFKKNPELVLQFYNQRRKQLLLAAPNEGHKDLVKLEDFYEVYIITQNIDDLHERAGSSQVIHLHGELRKAQSTLNKNLVYPWDKDIVIGDLCKEKSQLRPYIVWFGEEVPMLEKAVELTQIADILVVIGTSMQVYPAASLIHYAKPYIPIYFIDPNPAINKNSFKKLTIIQNIASLGVKKLLTFLTNSKG